MITEMPSINVIILNWNGYEDTMFSISSSLSQSYSNFHVTVIDNGSSDSSLDDLQKLQNDKLNLISSSENKGFAGGVNLGLKYSVEKKYDYCLLLNNDAILLPGAISNFVQFMQADDKLGICGGCVLNMDDDRVQVNGGKKINFLSGRCNNSEFMPDFISGALMFIRMKAAKNIGFLSEEYFMYWEDAEYSLRTLKKGWSIGVCESAIARHKAMASTENNISNYDYHFVRSSVIFFAAFGPKHLWLVPPIIVATKKYLKRLARGEFKNLKAISSAFKNGFQDIKRKL